MQVTLINHACVKLSIGGAVVLCDPWLDGPAFNFGWDLLVKTPLSLDEVMRDVTHIWVSHEHPDHFSPKFFNDIAGRYGSTVPVLFQQTRDNRVKSFLESRGFNVIELPDRKVQTIDSVRVICGCDDFYDSWLHIADDHGAILNLNDCGESEKAELDKISREIGPIDVLLTQFSYAAWKGGRTNAHFRAQAAQKKLETIAAQVRALKPRHTIPFASFVYFSNQENSYLNDHINTPEDASCAITAAGANPVILFPGDRWTVEEAYDDTAARKAYAKTYAHLPSLPLRPPGESVPLTRLKTEFDGYQKRLHAQNSPLLMRLLRRLPGLGAFRPVKIALTDLDTLVAVSVVDGFEILPAGTPSVATPDVTMHSSSLSFIFNNSFGYDTLTVNGRFEATPEGFANMTKSLALGSLNAMGLAISPMLILNFKVVLLLLRRLTSVVRVMAQGNDRSAQFRGSGT